MTTACRCIFTAILSLNLHAIAWASEPDNPKPIPNSRQSMLNALDKLKSRTARLPLPNSETIIGENVANNGSNIGAAQSRSLGVVNNGRMRALYLPEELSRRPNASAQPRSESDTAYQFTTELFWIVSRVNNCHYCLGHQEDKLLKLGVPESNLLLLDTDWSGFSAKHQAGLAFAKKLTQQPHRISRSDIDSMRLHYTTDEILEIAFLIGRYNATNRWTDSLGIPQESHRHFNTKLDPSQLELPSIVTVQAVNDRLFIADFQQWQNRMKAETANSELRKRFGTPDGGTLAAIEQLLTTIKTAGKDWADQVRDAHRVGKLDSALKAKIAFVAAQEDHAWDMQDDALVQLAANNVSPETAYALRIDLNNPSRTDATSAALKFSLKLTSQPQIMTDRDIADLEQYFDAQEIAEIVYHTGLAAMLNRLTLVASIASTQ